MPTPDPYDRVLREIRTYQTHTIAASAQHYRAHRIEESRYLLAVNHACRAIAERVIALSAERVCEHTWEQVDLFSDKVCTQCGMVLFP